MYPTKEMIDHYSYADTLDLLPYIENNKELYDVIENIRKAYPLPSNFMKNSSELFDVCDEYGIIEYLKNRYPQISVRTYTYEEHYLYIGE